MATNLHITPKQRTKCVEKHVQKMSYWHKIFCSETQQSSFDMSKIERSSKSRTKIKDTQLISNLH